MARGGVCVAGGLCMASGGVHGIGNICSMVTCVAGGGKHVWWGGHV